MPTRDREAVELQQHQQARPAPAPPGTRSAAAHADLSGRNRPRARALDAGVDVAIDQIVPGAAGAAHDDGADQEQQHVPGIGAPGAVGDGGERRRPPARQQQQPPADRPVETGQPQIGPQPVAARWCRPSFRSHRRRVRRPRSSRQGVAGQRVEGAAAGLLGGGVVGDDRPAERVAEARAGRRGHRRGAADLVADLDGLGVVGLDAG